MEEREPREVISRLIRLDPYKEMLKHAEGRCESELG